jgi:hypothetical protein
MSTIAKRCSASAEIPEPLQPTIVILNAVKISFGQR